MQEFTSRQAHRSPGPCPSAEDLAAYIDGTLDKAESGRITEHLASCEDCYTVYMETLDFQLESSPAEPGGVVDAEVVPFPARSAGERVRWATRWLPLAALLLVSVGSGTYFQLLARPPHLVPPPALPPLASLSPVEPGKSPLWLGPVYRGEGGEEETKIDEASFRMGVQFVNLQATLQAGRARDSQDVIAQILGLLKPQSLTEDLYNRYVGITTALGKRPPADLVPEAARLAKESREIFDDHSLTSLDLGQWVEAGRLAAMAQKPSFFQQADNRMFLRRLRWNDKLGLHEVKLDPATRESLDRISEIVSEGDLRPADYAELRTQLEKILDHYYPMT